MKYNNLLLIFIMEIILNGCQFYSPFGDNETMSIDSNPTPTPIFSNLIGWWKLDEGSGTVVSDSSGCGNNGTIYNTAEWETGVLVFTAANEAVVEITPLSFNFPTLNGPKTIAFWAYYDTVPTSTQNFIVLSNAAADSLIQFVIKNNVLQITGAHQPTTYVTSTAALPSAGSWHHYAYTYDGSTPNIYVDGTTINATGIGTPPSSNTVYVRFGSWETNGSDSFFEHFEGKLDNVRIYNISLSASDIMVLYNAGR